MRAVEIQLRELLQTTEVLQTFIGDERVSQIELGKLAHALQVGKPVIIERRIADVQISELSKWCEARPLHLRLRQPKLLEIGQFRQVRQAFVLHIDVGEEMEAEGELLQSRQIGQGLELFIGIEPAAGARIPLWTG